MIGEKRFNCQEMFEHACAFCECADIAFKKQGDENSNLGTFNFPAMVCSAFACEVYLKALLKFFDIEYKNEHELKKLYGALPIDLHILIYQIVFVEYDGRWKMEYFDEISNVFVQYRYIYERDWIKNPILTIDNGILNTFRNVLREACCELFFNLTWRQYRGDSDE